jgi:hypothetical protein
LGEKTEESKRVKGKKTGASEGLRKKTEKSERMRKKKEG